MRRLLEGGVNFTFHFSNAAFIRGNTLTESSSKSIASIFATVLPYRQNLESNVEKREFEKWNEQEKLYNVELLLMMFNYSLYFFQRLLQYICFASVISLTYNRLLSDVTTIFSTFQTAGVIGLRTLIV